MKAIRKIILIIFLFLVPVSLTANDETHLNLDRAILEQSRCLALNLYHEARGEPLKGILGVAHTTINRTKHKDFPDTVCGVVYQKNQFSWTGAKQKNINRQVYNRMYNISMAVMAGELKDPKFKSTIYFHSTNVYPEWASRMERVTQVGNHVFYSHK